MSRPPRTGTDPVATTERILRAAREEFSRHGFDATRLEDVAARAGIRRPSLLYHFPSKQVLYESVVRRVFEELGSELGAAMSEPGPFQSRFRAVVRAYDAFLESTPELATVILRELVDGRGPGRELLRHGLVPLLDRVEAFVEAEGHRLVRPGLPVRGIILQIAASRLLHAAAGTLRDALWGTDHDTVLLADALLFEAPVEV